MLAQGSRHAHHQDEAKTKIVSSGHRARRHRRRRGVRLLDQQLVPVPAPPTTGTNAAVTVNQTSVRDRPVPGSDSQALSGNFDNPNPGPTYVTAVTATGYTIDATHVTAAAPSPAATTRWAAPPTVAGDVPAGNGQGAWTGLTIPMNNLATNQDVCKGATVTITYASS